MATRIVFKIGDKFNYWKLLEYNSEKKKWLAECICGKVKIVHIGDLRSGKSTSCSCMGRGKHRMYGTPTYTSWSGAKGRCTNPNNERYAAYGGRGITMCERWLNSFENFYEDMGQRQEGTSLDRIDVDGNYEPDNCRWATPKEQSNNLRCQKEKGYSIKTLSEESGIPYTRLQDRLAKGWSVEEALSTELYWSNGTREGRNPRTTLLTGENKC